MNFKETAPKIIEYLGGKENIKTHTHCMTRLRFVLNDDAKADEEALKALKGVKGIVKQGGMFQVIIGVEVEQLYNEILPLLPDAEAAPVVENLNAEDKKESKMNQIFAFISGCIITDTACINRFRTYQCNFGIIVEFQCINK